MRPGAVYPIDLGGNPYAGQQLVYSPVIGAPMPGLGPTQTDPSLVFGQWAHQHPPPATYAPAYQTTPVVYGTLGQYQHHHHQPHHHRHHHPATIGQNQYAPIYGGSPHATLHQTSSSSQPAYQTHQNSWDPVMSTNMSQSIVDSVYSTNVAGASSSPANSNNDTKKAN